MARRSLTLRVLLNGRQVGWLSRAANGAIDFRYAQEWLDWEYVSPVSLSLPLDTRRYTGGAVTAVFDNLLPDNEDIRRRIAGRVGAEGADAYSLLAAVGRDCVGALQFLPEGEEVSPAGTVEAEPLEDEDIAAMLRNLGRAPLGLERDDAFRISIAGAQEKTALLWWEGRWNKPHGTTATTHIFKPQIGELPNGIDLSNSVENEHLCLTFLGALGMEVAPTRVATFGERPVLIVERFDRLWARDGRLLRRPQEDMCQALSVPPTRKYEDHGGPGVADIMKLLAASDRPDIDRRTLMKTLIAVWLLGATDGHAKNFSIFLSPGGRFAATPIYDVLSAEPSRALPRIRWIAGRCVLRWRSAIDVDIASTRSRRATSCRPPSARAMTRSLRARSCTSCARPQSRHSRPPSLPCRRERRQRWWSQSVPRSGSASG
jgi:serine/threonine-protein kinase HipA